MVEGKGKEVDPLTLAVVEARLNAMNEELGTRLFRQCFSVPTSHIRDLGTVLFDKDERTRMRQDMSYPAMTSARSNIAFCRLSVMEAGSTFHTMD